MTDCRSTSSHRKPIAALILAAGGASRMGLSKALLDWRGESLVRRAARAALESGCARVYVVVGCDGERVTAELRDLDTTIVAHPDWQAGMGNSIATGIAHIETDPADRADPAQGVVLILCDQPFVEASHVDTLCRLADETGHPIAACSFDQRTGPPAYFDRRIFPQLRALKGDHGARGIVRGRPDDVTLFECPAAAIDVDTPEDYQRALSMNGSEFA